MLFTETDFEFASYYASNMVLQREPSSAVIWGYATEVGDLVTLNIQDEEYSTNAVIGEIKDQYALIYLIIMFY